MVAVLTTAPSNAQTESQGDSIPLRKVLSELEKKAGVHFAFDRKLIEGVRVSALSGEGSIREQLEFALQSTGLCLREQDATHIIIHSCANSGTQKTWTLSGRLIDEKTGEELPFAAIEVEETRRGVTTDQHGRFVITDLQADSITLQCHYIGFNTIRLKVGKNQGSLKVAMQRQILALEEHTVTEYLQFMESGTDFSQLTVQSERLRGMPSIGEPDPIRNLRLLPGVGGNPEATTGIAMRGGKHDQTMILFDDFQVFQIDHLWGLFSTVNHHAVKDIQVYRSGYSAKFAGFAGGLIRITGKNGNQNKTSGGFGMNLYNTNLHLEVPVLRNENGPNLTTVVTFRKDNAGLLGKFWNDEVALPLLSSETISKTPKNEDRIALNGDLNFHDFSFKTMYRPNDRSSLTFTYHNSEDRWSIVGSALHVDSTLIDQDIDLTSSWKNQGAGFRWQREHTQKLKGSLSVTVSDFQSGTEFNKLVESFDGDTIQNLQDLSQENGFTQMEARYDLEWHKDTQQVWYAGLDLIRYESVVFAENVDTIEDSPLNQELIIATSYIEYQRDWKRFHFLLGNRFSLEADSTPSFFIEPRFSSYYKLSNHWQARGVAGIYRQYAKQFIPDIRAGLVPDFWFLPEGNLSLPITAYQASAGVSFNKKGWLIDTEGYVKKIQNTSEQFPSLNEILPESESVVRQLLIGSSDVAGIDMLIRKRFKHWSTWTGLETMSVLNTADSLVNPTYRPYYASTGTFKTGVLHARKNWDVGVTWMVILGRPFTDLYESEDEEEDEANFDDGTYQIGGSELTAYHRLDLAASYAFPLFKNEARIRVNVFNAYNRDNIREITYTRDYVLDEDEEEEESGEIREVAIFGLSRQFNVAFEWRF